MDKKYHIEDLIRILDASNTPTRGTVENPAALNAKASRDDLTRLWMAEQIEGSTSENFHWEKLDWNDLIIALEDFDELKNAPKSTSGYSYKKPRIDLPEDKIKSEKDNLIRVWVDTHYGNENPSISKDDFKKILSHVSDDKLKKELHERTGMKQEGLNELKKTN